MYRKTLSALIGLAGAESNNGKAEDTDAIVRQALLRMHEEDWSQRIREEKFRIAPNCATCSAPCGNTSDYPIEKWKVGQQISERSGSRLLGNCSVLRQWKTTPCRRLYIGQLPISATIWKRMPIKDYWRI